LKGDEERQGFVRKVFGILTAQIGFTVLLCSIVYAVKEIEDWLQDNLWFYFVCLGMTIAISCGLICFKRCARVVPYNYILLFTYTFFESMMVATISSFYEAESVFISAVMALVVFITLTFVACFTSRKPHTLAVMMYVCFSLSIVCIFMLIFFTSKFIVILVMIVLLIIT
jgi:protein lifeguard